LLFIPSSSRLRDITIKGPESKQQRSSHKSPGNGNGSESGEFGDSHPPTPTHQTTPKSRGGGNKSSEHFTFTPSSLVTPTTTPSSQQPHGVDPSMSVGPQPSSSPNLPIQRLTLFTDVAIEVPEENTTSDDADAAAVTTTATSIERFATSGTAPETPYLSSHHTSSPQPATELSSPQAAGAGADASVDVGELTVAINQKEEEGEEEYALGMEYDVVTTQYTTQQHDGHPPVGGSGGTSGIAPRKSSYRPNAHLELMTLSNSILRSSIDSLAFSSTKKYHHTGSIAGSNFLDGTSIANNATLEGELTDKAVSVVHRVMDKLIGLDFENKTALEISEQIDRLIQQATSNENLSSCFSGWCAFW
jgi:hypothetical protein